jgi:hypothetical protein
MVTYFIGLEEVDAYLRDLLERLDRFDPLPDLWCPVTASGNALLRRLVRLVREERPQWSEKVSALPIYLDERDGRTIRFDSSSILRRGNH